MSLILETIEGERSARSALLETIDAWAGVLLAFAAALAALAPEDVGLVVEVGRAAAVLGGLAALATFWPRMLLIGGAALSIATGLALDWPGG